MSNQSNFLALQCVQCSTMQVKQQKKSSNKWVCAVCNQRQSVMKVFARGPLARDLRKFVQGFNMSRTSFRSVHDDDGEEECHIGHGRDSSTEEGFEFDRKERTDWSEYLDPVVGDMEEEAEPEFVTEMPKEMLKRPFRKCPPKVWQPGGGVEEAGSFKPSFSNRKRKQYPQGTAKAEGCQKVVETGPSSKWDDYLDLDMEKKVLDLGKVPSREHFKFQKAAPAAKTGALSKWREYMEEENESREILTIGSVSPDSSKQEVDHMLRDILVEEEVHPDFK